MLFGCVALTQSHPRKTFQKKRVIKVLIKTRLCRKVTYDGNTCKGTDYKKYFSLPVLEVVHVKYLLGFSKNQSVPIFVKLGHNFFRRVFVVHAPQMFGFEGSSVAKPGDGREPVESKS